MSEKKSNVKIMYVRDAQQHPIGVVALRTDHSGLYAAASLCREGDVWNKQLGVLKATRRLDSELCIAVAQYGEQIADLGDVLGMLATSKRLHSKSFDRFDKTVQWMISPPKPKQKTLFDGETAGLP